MAEVAHYLDLGRSLALVINDLPEGARLDGKPLMREETGGLSRARTFLRAMANQQNVRVFGETAEAVRDAI